MIARLRAIEASAKPSDGVVCFARLYCNVTELVAADVGAGTFVAPTFLERLDIVFADLFFGVVANPARVPSAWAPLFAARSLRGIAPLQFALAGMNAHIEHDLPLAVLDAARALGRDPESYDTDFHRVNDLLAQVEAQVRQELLPDPTQAAEPLLHVLGVWSIDRARDAAWASVLALRGLRALPPAYQAYGAALDASVGMVSRALLTPVGG